MQTSTTDLGPDIPKLNFVIAWGCQDDSGETTFEFGFQILKPPRRMDETVKILAS